MYKFPWIILILVAASCRSAKPSAFRCQEELINTIASTISEQLKTNFYIIATNSKVKLPPFENIDSVMNSIGYGVYDDLVANTKRTPAKAEVKPSVSVEVPYLKFSEIIFDSTQKYIIVSYTKYYAPLFAEEVCAIYRIDKSRRNSTSVTLVFEQTLWRS